MRTRRDTPAEPGFRQRLLALVHTGVRPDTPRPLAKRITVTNAYCLTVIVLMQPYIPVFAVAGAWFLAWMIPAVSAALVAPLWLHHRGAYTAGRVLMLGASITAVLLYSLALGADAGIHLFCLPLAASSLVIFGSEERGPRYLTMAAAMSALVGSLVWSAHNPGWFELTGTLALVLYIACALSALMLLMTTLAYLEYAQERAEHEVEDVHLSIEAELGQRYRRLVDERKEIDAQLRLSDRLAAVGTLAAGVAHEINNPLTYIGLNLELVRRALDKGDADAALRAIRKGAEGVDRVAVIVRDLMTFSRGDEESRGPVDVVQVLDSTLNIAHSKLRHGGEVRRDYRDAALVWANEARLGQVFLNLVLNANQAVRPASQGGVIELAVMPGRDGDSVVVEVRDNGEGIAEDAQQRIFDPFFTTKPVGVGTGLGLYITRRIVEELGGSIEVDSAVGRGTTFRLSLPTAERGAADSRAQSAGSMAAGLRVLVVDDEPDVCQVLRALLDRHEVRAVTSGEEALSALGDGAFDLVLCDVMMSPLSGAQLYESVLASNPAAAARFVFMTGGAVNQEAARFLDRVDRPVLSKPVQLADLDAALADAAAHDEPALAHA